MDKGSGDQVTFFSSICLGEMEESQGVTLVHAWGSSYLLHPLPTSEAHCVPLYAALLCELNLRLYHEIYLE